MKIVLKVGGNEIDDPIFLNKLSKLVTQIRSAGHSTVLVHGGGKEITGLLDKLGIKTEFVDGLRYTDAATLDAVEMVLSGLINKRLVKTLLESGVNSIGLSGIDGGILVAEKITREGKDIGFVGKVSKVDVETLTTMMEKFVVVLSPLAMDATGKTSLNVNADFAAAAVSSSLKSELIIFLSNVPGVFKDGRTVPKINQQEFENLKRAGVISGGMVPKIEAALFALREGSLRAVVADTEGAAAIVSGAAAGTQVFI